MVGKSRSRRRAAVTKWTEVLLGSHCGRRYVVSKRFGLFFDREWMMKITDILTYGVNVGDGNHIFVKVLTDEHLYGIGEAYRVGPDQAVEQTVH